MLPAWWSRATDPTGRKDMINITIEVEDMAEAPDYHGGRPDDNGNKRSPGELR